MCFMFQPGQHEEEVLNVVQISHLVDPSRDTLGNQVKTLTGLPSGRLRPYPQLSAKVGKAFYIIFKTSLIFDNLGGGGE
jgi:hypothetical protein